MRYNSHPTDFSHEFNTEQQRWKASVFKNILVHLLTGPKREEEIAVFTCCWRPLRWTLWPLGRSTCASWSRGWVWVYSRCGRGWHGCVPSRWLWVWWMDTHNIEYIVNHSDCRDRVLKSKSLYMVHSVFQCAYSKNDTVPLGNDYLILISLQNQLVKAMVGMGPNPPVTTCCLIV